MSFISSLALGTPAAASTVPLSVGASTVAAAAAAPTRDAAVTDLASITNSVNGLAQASAAQSTDSSALALTLPPLPAMPAPNPPPAVPTDDHGTSNVVFSDPEFGGDLIH